MKVVLQRVKNASVRVDGDVVGSIGRGLCLLVGIGGDDTMADVDLAVEKIPNLRVFADEQGSMNRSLVDVNGEMLIVSQFTLHGDATRGRRPSFSAAARRDQAEPLIMAMAEGFRESGIATSEGKFGATMEVELINDGPVTLILEFSAGSAL